MKTYNLLILIFILEFSILFSVLLTLLFARIHFFFQIGYTKKRQEEINRFLIELCRKKTLPKSITFPKRPLPSHLLSSLEDFDHRFNDENWIKVKQALTKTYLLPRARRTYKSLFWKKRLFSARCLALFCEKQDHAFISALLHDSSFLILDKAGRAALSSKDFSLIKQLVEQASKFFGYPSFFFKDLFSKKDMEIFHFLEKILRETSCLKTRLFCLEVLLSKSHPLPFSLLEEYAKASEEEKRFLSIRYLAHNPQNGAHLILLHAMKDPSTKVQQEAALGLSFYPQEKTVQALELGLQSNIWQVSLAAAKSLKKLAPKQLQKRKEAAAFYVRALDL